MKYRFFLAIMLMAAVVSNSFGSTIQQRKITLGVFHKLTIIGNAKVIIAQGDEPALVITGTPDAINQIEFLQKDDELVINKVTGDIGDAILYITAKDLSSIEIKNDAQVSCSNSLQGETLSVMLTGNGDIHLKSDAQQVVAMSTSKGRICVEGDFHSSVTRMDSYNRLITAYCKR